MIKDFHVPLLGIDDRPFTRPEAGEDGDSPSQAVIYVSSLIVDALTAVHHDEKPTRDEKLKRARLALKIQKEEKDFSIEELAMIQERIDRQFPSPIIALRVDEIINAG